MSARIVVTGSGAICAAGKSPEEIWGAAWTGRSAIRPIQQWDTSGWPTTLAAEIPGLDPRALVEDRKIHKLVQRTDLLGLYVAGRALDDAGLVAYREALESADAATVNDRTGVYVGSGSGGYQNEHEFFPLLTTANGDLGTFGRELGASVSPMWLLRSMPSNVLCHIGIRYGLKGPNACVTNHSVSGSLAVVEAAAALRAGEADRALAVGHDAPIEPQMVLVYHQLGLLSADGLWPFDARRSGSVLGEGAAALVLETEAAAAARGAHVIGEFLGSGCASDAEGLLAIRPDGDGLAGAIVMALRRRRDSPGRGRDDRGPRKRHAAIGRFGGRGHPPGVRCDDPARHRVQVGLWASSGRLGYPGCRAGPGRPAPRRGSRRGDPAPAGS